jgi:hypothetical protein
MLAPFRLPSYGYRVSDFKAHQILPDLQRAAVGLPRFGDEIAKPTDTERN